MAEEGSCRLREVSGGMIATYAGAICGTFTGDGLPAQQGALLGPLGLAVDPSGRILAIADVGHARVREIVDGVMSTAIGCALPCGPGPGGTNTPLSSPASVVFESDGSLLVADYGRCQVLRLTNGVVSVLAGQDHGCFFAGDGGAATGAALNQPISVAVGPNGDVFIAEMGDCRIRRVRDGLITTVAGGVCGYSGDNGPATSAAIIAASIAVDAGGNVYALDIWGRVRKVADGIITTIAGTGTSGYSGDGGSALNAQFNGPRGVNVAPDGDLYIADTFNEVVRKISGGVITTVAGKGPQWAGFAGDGGPATQALLNEPQGVAVDASGNLYIADSGNSLVREVFGIGDTDGDGCADGQEPLLVPPTDPSNPWDFYSVPIPALFAAPDPLTDFKDNAVAASDAQAVFAYFKAGAVAGTTLYEQDLNGNGIPDGVEYDRSVVGPGVSGPPTGVVSAAAAQLAFAQFKNGYRC